MKKIILLIIVSLGVVSILQSQEQTVYKPFWGKDSTVQYIYFPTQGFYVDYDSYRKIIFEANEDGREGYFWGFQKALSGENNSKLWATNDLLWKDSVLIADMNLAIGDSFEIVNGIKNVVTNVYWERGLKHIQFDLSFYVESDSVNQDLQTRFQRVFYEIVEGVGSIYPDIKSEWFGWLCPYPLKPDEKYYGGITIRGVWRDGSPFYIHPLWKNLWNYDELSNPYVVETGTDKISVSCGKDDLLRVKVMNFSSNMKVEIYGLDGNLLFSDSFLGNYECSLTSFQRGVYLVKINKYTTKILLQ